MDLFLRDRNGLKRGPVFDNVGQRGCRETAVCPTDGSSMVADGFLGNWVLVHDNPVGDPVQEESWAG